MPTKDGNFGRRTYLKGAGAAGAVALTGLAGCNGGDGGDTSSSSTTGGTSSSDSGSETITIGATVPETGAYSALGDDFKRGYQLGVKLMNQNMDQNVELVLKDDESDAQKVRSTLQQIVSNNDVDMLWGSFSSLLVTAGSAYAEQQGIPFVGTAFAYMAPHQDNNYEWTYAAMPKSKGVAQATKGMLELIPESERPSKIGIWEPNTGWGNEQANYWEDTLGGDYDIALREKYSLGAKDFSTLISKSQSAGVEVLLSVPVPPGAITAVKQMASQGWTPKAIQFVRGADPSAFRSALGKNATGVTMCPGWVPGLTGNGNAALTKMARENYDEYSQGQLLPVMIGASFNVAQVAQQAFQNAGGTSPTDVQSALRSTDFETVIGNFSFSDNGLPQGLEAPIGQWYEGAQHLAYPATDADAAIDFQYPLTPFGER
ncbi:MAG: ABC transporter substrate-binding protein [Halarchaeum sp.]